MQRIERLERRFFWGMASGAGSVAIRSLLNLMLIPVLVRTLGIEYFGLYILLVTILEIAIMMDLGVTSALVRLLGRYSVTDPSTVNRMRKETYLKVAHRFYAGLALMFLLTGLTFIPSFPLLFNVQDSLANLSRMALFLILLEGAVAIYSSHFRAILLSHCAHQWTNVADTTYYVLGTGAGLMMVLAGYGLPGLLLVRLCAAVLAVAFMAWRAVRVEPAALVQKARFRMAALKEVLYLGGHAFAVNLSILVSHKIDAFVIAHFLSLSAVGVFEIVFRLLGICVQISLKLAEGIMPMFSGLAAENRKPEARRLFLRMSGFLNIVAVLMLTLLVGCFPYLFREIAEDRAPLNVAWPIVALAVPILWSGVLQMPANYYLYSCGRHSYLTLSSLCAALANLGLSLLLVQPFGMIGVAVGTLIPQVIQHQASLIREACRELEISFRQYVLAVHRPIVVPLLATLLWLACCQPLLHLAQIAQSSDVWMLLVCAVTGAGGMFVGLGLWFARSASEEEKTFARALLMKVWDRNREDSGKSRERSLLWKKNKLRPVR